MISSLFLMFAEAVHQARKAYIMMDWTNVLYSVILIETEMHLCLK